MWLSIIFISPCGRMKNYYFYRPKKETMLQRIQTIYLVAGILWTISVGYLSEILIVDGRTVKLSEDPLITGLLATVVVLFAAGIGMYRNRNAQVRINRINIFYNLVLFGGLAYFAYYHSPQIDGLSAHLGVGSVIPVINVVLLTLANRGIMADEELVRSLDRLR